MTPPKAGPTARLTFMPTLFAAIAGLKSAFGTSCGTTACHAGEVNVLATLVRKVNSRRLNGVARLNQTIAANIVDVIVMLDSPTIRNKRLSIMSARAPAGIAKRNIGNVVATCTSDTISGSGLRLVISHADAALKIQPPIFETTVAVQIAVKIG